MEGSDDTEGLDVEKSEVELDTTTNNKRKASEIPEDDDATQTVKKQKTEDAEGDDGDEEEDDGDEDEPKKEDSGAAVEPDDNDGSAATSYVIDGVEYPYKERPAVVEEQDGVIEFRVVNNDGTRDHLIILMGLKNIFQKQLPEMPREYIARLVFDRSHISIAIVKNKPNPMTVVGGITFRPFEAREFAEIVFCAVSSEQQVRGYGAHLMNHLKDYVKTTSNVKHFLTYADNYAIGYFKKQGFTKEISLSDATWMGYIKDYEGGTIMQCTMLPRMRYLDSNKILLLQKAAIARKIRASSRSHIVYSGLDVFRHPLPADFEGIDSMTIPGLKEAGWTPEMDAIARRPKRSQHFAVMQQLLTEMQKHASSWPFRQPVNPDEVADYYTFIKEPMDLSTMTQRLEEDKYSTVELFLYDARLIFNNCRAYNSESSNYYKNATKLERFLEQKIKEYPEYSYLLD